MANSNNHNRRQPATPNPRVNPSYIRLPTSGETEEQANVADEIFDRPTSEAERSPIRFRNSNSQRNLLQPLRQGEEIIPNDESRSPARANNTNALRSRLPDRPRRIAPLPENYNNEPPIVRSNSSFIYPIPHVELLPTG